LVMHNFTEIKWDMSEQGILYAKLKE